MEICVGVQQIPWFRLFSALYLRGGLVGGGGGGGGNKTGYITAKAFSYPHTEFGGRRSRCLALKCATN